MITTNKISNDGMTLIYNDKTLTLTTEPEPYNDAEERYPEWRACATDNEGHDYVVTWYEQEDFNGEDAAYACDWDFFEVRKR